MYATKEHNMYICIYLYMHICMHINVWIYIRDLDVCQRGIIHVYMYICTHVYMYMFIYVYMYIHICMNIHQRPICMPKRHMICIYVHCVYVYMHIRRYLNVWIYIRDLDVC